MYLKQLKLSTLRNLNNASLDFSEQFNWIFGKNGSGKTSLLETIYLLSTGRSFRTNKASEFIQKGQISCIASGTILNKNGPFTCRLGVERHKQSGLRLRMNEKPCETLSDWVKVLPLQLINIDSYQLLEGPSKSRRQFLDWAMFHVEHSYYSHLKRYQRTLKQRNAALKSRKPGLYQDIEVWNCELVESGQVLTSFRKQFLAIFCPFLIRFLNQFLIDLGPFDDLQLEFKPGWDEQECLASAFRLNIDRDIALGFTSLGPHRADIKFRFGNSFIETLLSRGQLKMFISALYLARSAFFMETMGYAPICLVDDLCSELDRDAVNRLLQGLLEQEAQVFITSIDQEMILERIKQMKDLDYKLFHVEHGNFSPI